VALPGVRTDAELLDAAGQDPAAFRELYARHAERIHRFHTARTRDPDAALDLTAETFAQAWEHRASFADLRGGSCGPWLFGIARNLLLRAVRDRRLALEASERLRLTLPDALVVPAPDWVDGLDEDLERALAALPGGQREAVESRVLRDASYDQVAAELDCSPGAARIRVHRGLASMRDALAASPPAGAPRDLQDERTA
jgi:RNA polymerase sigma factor (sigma-70 family)